MKRIGKVLLGAATVIAVGALVYFVIDDYQYRLYGPDDDFDDDDEYEYDDEDFNVHVSKGEKTSEKSE